MHDLFLSYNPGNEERVERIAAWLRADARFRFWFRPWHSLSGLPEQEQEQAALMASRCCAVFAGGGQDAHIAQWQALQSQVAMRRAIEQGYLVFTVLFDGFRRQDLPPFLQEFNPILYDETPRTAAKIIAAIQGIRPIDVPEFLDAQQRAEIARTSAIIAAPTGSQSAAQGRFPGGHALLVGIADYASGIRGLPSAVRNDVSALATALRDPKIAGYPAEQVIELLDAVATATAIRQQLIRLGQRTSSADTAIVYFSGHGYSDGREQYLVPHDGDLSRLRETALCCEELTQLLSGIRAGRLLVLLDCCHSGGIADATARGVDAQFFGRLAQGEGRVVIAASRADERSYILPAVAAHHSLFTFFVLEALRGQARTLGDGYLRVFDLFRHLTENVPRHARLHQLHQHPIFKAHDLDLDFALAAAPEQGSAAALP